MQEFINEPISVKTIQFSNNAVTQNMHSDLAREFFVKMIINEALTINQTCSPTDIKEMIVGRLISDNIIHTASEILSIETASNNSEITSQIIIKNQNASVFNNNAENNTQLFQEAQSDICTINRTRDSLNADFNLQMLQDICDDIMKLPEISKSTQKIHKKTSSTHCCSLFYDMKLSKSFEDIERHSALDKAIGHAYMNSFETNKCLIYFTGRISQKTVLKLINSRIPVIVSKSVPTYEALNLAIKNNILLICKAWPDSFEVYQPE